MLKAGAPAGQIDIIAHRGASAYAPENTLSAFELAAELGADWFELDCTLSKDGAIVVIHDDTVDRTTDGAGRVGDLDYHGDMDAYDAGTWFDEKFSGQRLPTLGQALDLARDRIGVYIEVKDSADDTGLIAELLSLLENEAAPSPELNARLLAQIERSGSHNLVLTRKVIDEVVQRGMEAQVVIQSFSPVICAFAGAAAPAIPAELLGCRNPDRPEMWGQFLRWIPWLPVSGFNIRIDDIGDKFVHNVHTMGKTVAVWTVNGEADMERMFDIGVDALITDRPDVALAVRRRRTQHDL